MNHGRRTIHRVARPAARGARGNAIVLVMAVLALLVILATAYVVRSRGGRVQAAAQQAWFGRNARTETIAMDIAQEVADALFPKLIDRNRMPDQVAANRALGLQGRPLEGEFLARSDFPRLPPSAVLDHEFGPGSEQFPELTGIRYGVDPFDFVDNRTLAGKPGPSVAVATPDGIVDGYNFAPYSVIPYTNWPARYGPVGGESSRLGSSVGNPGFGDSRWLASTEPLRAQLQRQVVTPIMPAPPNEQMSIPLNPGWSNLALNAQGAPILDPEGLGFSHWPHLSWIATAENGYRVAWNIAALDQASAGDFLTNPGESGVLTGPPGTVQGELSLGIPYEQWLTNVAPREPAILGKNSEGYLVLDRTADAGKWRARVREWFNVGVQNLSLGSPAPHEQIVRGVSPTAADLPGPSAAGRRADALPNFLQLAAFGSPADEFAFEVVGGATVPHSRNLISRTLADADGDGWTDSFWFVSPTPSDRGTRQLVAVRVIDNSSMVNVNTATRFERSNTIGQTPSDVALVTRRESYDEVAGGVAPASAAQRDPVVGFFNSRENDPEYRTNFQFRVPGFGGQTAPTAGQYAPLLVYAVNERAGVPTGGVDVGWFPNRWEGPRRQPAAATAAQADAYQGGVLRTLGLITEGAPGQLNGVLPFFDTSVDYGTGGSGSTYGDLFLLTRPVDRLSYFKAMAAEGEIIDPVTAARVASLSPFSSDDEAELRAANGLNHPMAVSRLETAMNDSAPLAWNEVRFGQFLRSTRSREETSGFFPPTDVRLQDWRARGDWPPSSGASYAPRSGVELLLDHRRLLTTISGARNELLPPRLWTVRDHSEHKLPANAAQDPDENINNRAEDISLARPAFVETAVGGGLPPYHPNVMFTNAGLHPLIPPGAGNPYGRAVADADRNGRITEADFTRARRRFLLDNRKIDLRRPVDEPVPVAGNPSAQAVADPDSIRQETWGLLRDLQRVIRRSTIDDLSEQSYLHTPVPGGVDAQDPATLEALRTSRRKAMLATKMMALSYATNMLTWRDGPRNLGGLFGIADQPFHPDDLPALVGDVVEPLQALADEQLPNAAAGRDLRFVGVEKQPFFQEAFIAFVYPPATQSVLQAALDRGGVQDCEVTSDVLPTCTNELSGVGGRLVGYDPAIRATHPAVVFVVQLANPYNEPVSLSDLALRLNFRDRSVIVPLRGAYGPNAELGPCTPEEPRSLIVYSVPDIFPDGRPFPRDAWLDFLDLRAPVVDRLDDSNNRLDNEDYVVTPVGVDFPPDTNALFRPAFGPLRSAYSRGGTLLVDATANINAPHASAQPGLPSPGIPADRPLTRWLPPESPKTSMVELVRQARRQLGNPPPGQQSALVVIDRLRNVFELDAPGSGSSAPAGSGPNVPTDGLGLEEDFDQRVREMTDWSSPYGLRHIPPPIIALVDPDDPTGANRGRTRVSGIRVGLNDSFATWARTSRQWLFDTEFGTSSPGPGLNRLTVDERAPRWVMSRQVGTRTSSDVADSDAGGLSTIRDSAEATVVVRPYSSAQPPELRPGTNFPGRTISFFDTVDGQPVPAGRAYCVPDGGQFTDGILQPGSQGDPERLPIVMNYRDVWGQQRSGKPTFFPSRIATHGLTGGPDNRIRYHRRYDYPAWGARDRDMFNGLDGMSVSYGEKGAVEPEFVDGDQPWAFVSPLRMYQKDADFDQIAEILDVPVWGPVVHLGSGRTVATLAEILAQGPKAAKSFPMPPGRGRQSALNRLVIDPPVDAPVASAGSSARRELVSGTALVPTPADPDFDPLAAVPASAPRQGAIGFNSALVSGAALLDAFTIDDRGQLPFDADDDKSIEQNERAVAENRRFRLARNFEGKLTPGLININTAPVEVLRSMPQMLRLVYDDDFPITLGAGSDPATFDQPASQLGIRRGLRDNMPGPNVSGPGNPPAPAQQALWSSTPYDHRDAAGPGNSSSIWFDYGVAAPRVRVAEAIELWRNKGNVLPNYSRTEARHLFPGMPSYFHRGLPSAGRHAWAPGMRVERGFDSLGELALLTQGAEVLPSGANPAIADPRQIASGFVPDVNRDGVDDREEVADTDSSNTSIEQSWNTIMGWSINFAGLDPFRTRWGRTAGASETAEQMAASASWGRGWLTEAPEVYANQAVGNPGSRRPFTDGIPRQLDQAFVQQFPLSGRTAIDRHLLTVATDNPGTTGVETDDPETPANLRVEREIQRYDPTAGDVVEQNQILKGISNIVTTRSDVFTVWLRIRTIKQDTLTGRWNGADKSLIVDDSRYVMTIDRSSVDRPGERPRIINFTKVTN